MPRPIPPFKPVPANALIPGLVDTELTRYDARYKNAIAETGKEAPDHPTPQQAWDARPDGAVESRLARTRGHIARRVFLASDAAAMVTGAEYEVTGGDSAKDV